MHHIHLDRCKSTQGYLIENIKEYQKNADKRVLVSSSNQYAGVGRSNNNWDDSENSLAFSFLLKPNKEITLTPLEIAVLVVDFFHVEFNINTCLKWPNDLLKNDGTKYGGIISNFVNKDIIVIGIGINFSKPKLKKKTQNYKTPVGYLFEKKKLLDEDHKNISKKIYEHILNNRMESQEMIRNWNKLCLHLDKRVKVFNDIDEHVGLFKGVGEIGEAIIEIEDNFEIVKLISGHLNIL